MKLKVKIVSPIKFKIRLDSNNTAIKCRWINHSNMIDRQGRVLAQQFIGYTVLIASEI